MLSGRFYQVLFAWLAAVTVASAQQPAFPGAEGFGQFASGGRSGTVYHVTNLSDSGSGSFRDAVSQANRTIVFDISGTINLSSALSITRSNLTIAGQTAPGDGISTKGWMTEVKARNVIVRFLRCRPGDINCTNSMNDDAFHFDSASNCVADHVSASWSLDEALSTTKSTNVTVQWCMIELPLNHSCHDEGSGIQNHGYGSLIRYAAGGITYHHNLYAHCLGRNPRGPSDNIRLDFVNNVVYNWGNLAGYDEDDTKDSGRYTNSANYVGNYLIAGTNTTQSPPLVFRCGLTNVFASTQIFQTNNFVDGNKNGLLDGADNGWTAFGFSNRSFTTNLTRFPFPQVTTDTPNAAYVRVLSSAGASSVRDVVDSGVVSNVLNQNGIIIDSQTQVGGWPTLNSLAAPLDTDQDGMPDFWEIALGSNTNNAADRNDLMPDGYTRLEWYLNWLAGPHTRCTNSFVDVNLQPYATGVKIPTYSVISPSNGTVALLGDGFTARFTPSLNATGLASFVFTASGSPASLTGTVSVLVSPITVVAPAAKFTAGPTNGVEPLVVTFTDTSTGTTPLSLSWNFGDSSTTNTTDGASFTHPYSAGIYTVTLIASNSAGASTLVSNNLIKVITALQAWQLQYFGCTNCAVANPDSDPDGDGMSNSNEFLTGTSPTNTLSTFQVISVLPQSDDMLVTWKTAGGRTNRVEVAASGAGYATNFNDLSGPIIISGSGDQTTNFADVGGMTNVPSRYYRIRLAP